MYNEIDSEWKYFVSETPPFNKDILVFLKNGVVKRGKYVLIQAVRESHNHIPGICNSYERIVESKQVFYEHNEQDLIFEDIIKRDILFWKPFKLPEAYGKDIKKFI